MPPRLIINADDFGLTRGINRAIAELHAAGAVTSATLMANGPAFQDAVAIAHAHPTLGVGCHIVLTDGVPISPPESIPTLIGDDGKSFRPSLIDFLTTVVLGRISEDDIAREALAQVRKLQHAGIHVTHLDTHKHTHILPAVTRPLLAIAELTGVRAIRDPFEQHWSLAVSHSSFVRSLQVRISGMLRKRFESLPQIRNGVVLTTQGTIGISATGRLDASTLEAILKAMPEGLWELVCHPGYNDRDLDAITTRLRYTREVEHEALLAQLGDDLTHPLPVELIHYGKLGSASLEATRSATTGHTASAHETGS